MTSDEDFVAELKATFLEELDDVLEMIESAFLRFETNPTDKDILSEIFRYFHNVKGSSKTVGFTDLSQFAHSAENLLSKLRNNEIKISDDIVDCLLGSLDVMRSYSVALKGGEADPRQLLEQMNRLLELEQRGGEAIDQSMQLVEGLPAEQRGDELAIQGAQEGQQQVDDSGFGFFDNDDADAQQPASSIGDGSDGCPIEGPDTAVLADSIGQDSQRSDGRGDPPKKVIHQEEYLKVSMTKINQILDLFGEQVILQSSLDHAMTNDEIDFDFIQKSIGQLKKITQDLQHTMVTLRMVSMESTFNRLQRSIRDVARLTGKKVEFVKIGEKAELDKTIVDALIDPLTHMVRNAVDHGIEMPEERISCGKPETGTVKLIAQRTGGVFEIILEDDGKGLDRDKLLQKAVERGLVSSGAKLSDNQIYELIFASGFSTRDQATEISGRGVGMDVVRQQITRLKGSCSVDSQLGQGSRFVLRVPLSLAMFNGTVVSVNDQRYVIPNSDFCETITLQDFSAKTATGSEQSIRVGERVLSIIDLRERLVNNQHGLLQREQEIDRSCLAIVARQDQSEYALLVNDILSQEQIVLKELGPEAKQIRGASGGTILGDGAVALVLDINAIIKRDRISQATRRA